MHSWHWELFASTAPSCCGDENSEFGMPATYAFVFSGSVMMRFGMGRFPSSSPFSYDLLRNSRTICSLRAPTASNFSSPNPTASISLWQVAHEGLVVCSDIRSRLVWGLASVTGGRFVLTPGG